MRPLTILGLVAVAALSATVWCIETATVRADGHTVTTSAADRGPAAAQSTRARAGAAGTPRAQGRDLPAYKGFTPYGRLAAVLADIDRRSRRVTVYRNGRSAGGRQLWTIVVTRPFGAATRRLNDEYRKTLLTDPAAARAMVSDSVRPAVVVSCSVHGDETTGTDAGLELLRRLAFADDEQTLQVLDRLVVVIDPVANPDGRVGGTRANAAGFDVNRDLLTLTQPESRATVRTLRRWVPIQFHDLHGYVSPMLIEPCGIPHNPNYEYDLFIKRALPLADYQRAYLLRRTGLRSQTPYLWGTADDPLETTNDGWDDYAPIYSAMMAMYYGAVGQTLEAPSATRRGVDAHVATTWAALLFATRNAGQMMLDQADALIRGDRGVSPESSGRPWRGNMTAMLRPVPWGDPGFPYGDLVGDTRFPSAYVIPAERPLQTDPWQAGRLVDHLLRFGMEVRRATVPFSAAGVTYPAGTWVAPTGQPLRGLLNTMLWDGEDVSATYGVDQLYDIAAWSLPDLWGVDVVAVNGPTAAVLRSVQSADRARGGLRGTARWYVFDGTGNGSVRLVNDLLGRGFTVGMVTRPIAGALGRLPLGAFVVRVDDRSSKTRLRRAAARHRLLLSATPGLSARQVTVLRRPSVRVNAGSETAWVLRQYLGFRDVTSGRTLPGSATVFVNGRGSSSGPTPAAVRRWLAGAPATVVRTYVGVGAAATGFGPSRYEALIPGVSARRPTTSTDNGIVHVRYSPDSILGSGYPPDGAAFARPLVWFTGHGPGLEVATYAAGSSAGPYHSGLWRDPAGAAVGSAAALDYRPGARSRVVFYGFQPTFRGMTEGTYLTLARAVLLSRSTPPSAP